MTPPGQDRFPDLARRLEPPRHRVAAVLDTDTYNEIDDQFALAYALLCPERIDLQAIYAAPFHNERSTGPGDGMEKSHEEILRLLALMRHRAEGLVFKGSTRFLPDATTPVASDAASDLVERAMSRSADDPPLYVLAIAAITNVASAILLEPRITERIVVVWLGGQPHGWPSAREFNLEQDVHAARLIFDCGVPLIHVPCTQVAEHLRTTQAELAHYLKGRGALGDYLVQIFDEFCGRVAEELRRNHGVEHLAIGKELWDVATVACLAHAEWTPSHLTPSPILTDQLTWSRDPSRHPVRVVHDVRRDLIFGDLFQRVATTA